MSCIRGLQALHTAARARTVGRFTLGRAAGCRCVRLPERGVRVVLIVTGCVEGSVEDLTALLQTLA
ncbi:hypothetical protein UC8_17430 [Roseimaritima ulvae]|uniref:Uncharacterized protein n=1 Tax=Roseimaritima ulvae TaxID=980254 RepID=A0A5B9QQF7_9BACT|nr:hypothetical protein UC8_17430 [Roseimaritima ulvae]